jgi:DHA1 family bicyclomycin/chloramphenicol resistance-like MFS transporter
MTSGFVILCGLAFAMTIYEKRYLKALERVGG